MTDRIQETILAFACGDATGMPTEFMTRTDLKEKFPKGISAPLRQDQSQNHSNLPQYSVTDDTEQVIYLYETYQKDGEAGIYNTVDALNRWIVETKADEKKYIGPSSKKALDSIANGGDPMEAGITGTTCGGIMRSPSAAFFAYEKGEDALVEALYHCCLPTHNTSEALEAAGAYGFALASALKGCSFEEIIESACKGGKLLQAKAPWQGSAPSSVSRIQDVIALHLKDDELLDRLFYIYGTGLPSCDVCGAVFALFAQCREDSWRAIRLAAHVGGDTDTIAALAGALCTAYAGKNNIPQKILKAIRLENKALLERVGL